MYNIIHFTRHTKIPGQLDTKCEKLPVNICGAGCSTREGPEECREEEVDTVVEVPMEHCDLSPRKTCQQVCMSTRNTLKEF